MEVSDLSHIGRSLVDDWKKTSYYGLKRRSRMSPQHFDHCDEKYRCRVKTTLHRCRFVKKYDIS